MSKDRVTRAKEVHAAHRCKPKPVTREAVFCAFLDDYWPLWRQHEGGPVWHGLRAAFMAGYGAANAKET